MFVENLDYNAYFLYRLNYMKNKNVLKRGGGSPEIYMTILL